MTAVRGMRAVLAGVALLFAISSLWLVYAATPSEDKREAKQTAPIIPQAKGEQCVADTALMRTDHMELLNHQRDETVIEGIRGKPFSLAQCVECHAQTAADGTAVRIDAEGQFCQSCHAFAAVKIDCFTCHAAKPEQKEMIGQQQLWGHGNLAHVEMFKKHATVSDGFEISADRYTAKRHETRSK